MGSPVLGLCPLPEAVARDSPCPLAALAKPCSHPRRRPHPPAPCGSVRCFVENVMTRQPLSFQACFQLLGGETSAVVFRFGTAEGFTVRGDWRGDSIPQLKEGSLSLRVPA